MLTSTRRRPSFAERVGYLLGVMSLLVLLTAAVALWLALILAAAWVWVHLR